MDVLKLASQYEIQLDQAKADIANHPDIEKHGAMLQAANDAIQTDLIKKNPNVSSAAQTAFEHHAIQRYTVAAVDLAQMGRAKAVERQVVDLTQRGEAIVDAASMVAPGNAFGNDRSHIPGQERATVEHLIQSFTDNGTLHPQKAEELKDRLNNRYWEQRATEFPEHVMQVVGTGKLGFDDFNMDQAKAQHYNAIAVNVLNQRQAAVDRAAKAEEAAVKKGQELTAASVTADIIERKPVNVAPLVRSRQLDDTRGQTLNDLQTNYAQEQDPAKYQKGLAANTEMMLEQQKYDNKPLDTRLVDTITDDFLRDRITKDEHTHLMGVLASVEAYKHQEGKEDANKHIANAKDVLDRKLRVVGPGGMFLKPISEQTIAEANEFYYRRIRQDPKADPFKIMQEAVDIFRPGVEKDIGLSKIEKTTLDHARLEDLVHQKAVSPAAAKALRAKEEDTEGKRIVQEALKNLPPPPPPGLFDRLQGLNPFKKKEAIAGERKPAGVMGE